MTRNVKTLVALMGIGVFASSTLALCPNEKEKSGVKLVKSTEDSGSETVKSEGTAPCGGKSAKASATPCGKSAKTASAPCGKSAKTASAPCGKSATTVSAPCSKSATASSTPCSKSKSATAPCGGKSGALVSAKGDCPIEAKVQAVLASLPSQRFKVAGEVTPCRQSAGAMAKAKHTEIEYLVGDESFSSQDKAEVRLASMIEERIETMKTVRFASGKKCFGCPTQAKTEAAKSGTQLTYRVGGVDFADKESAEKAAALASERLSAVKMSYRVGKQSFCCDRMAGAKAKETGEKTIFIVGEDETDCPAQAQQLMAKAKLAAVISAAMAVLAS